MAVVRDVTAIGLLLLLLLHMAVISAGGHEFHTKGRRLGGTPKPSMISLDDDIILHILRHHPPKSVVQFVNFKDKFGKVYTSETEVKKRYAIFTDNVKYIKEHNEKKSSYKLGVNEWTDLTLEEFAAAHGMNSTRPGGEFEH